MSTFAYIPSVVTCGILDCILRAEISGSFRVIKRHGSVSRQVLHCLRMYSVWCTRYGLLAIPTTSGSLLSGEGESEMERERARATESERGRYETDDALMFCLGPSFVHRDTRSFACATGVRDDCKHIR